LRIASAKHTSIDARKRDVGSDTDHDQQTGGEQQARPQLLDLKDISETFREFTH
jgi:hypothetical protein